MHHGKTYVNVIFAIIVTCLELTSMVVVVDKLFIIPHQAVDSACCSLGRAKINVVTAWLVVRAHCPATKPTCAYRVQLATVGYAYIMKRYAQRTCMKRYAHCDVA